MKITTVGIDLAKSVFQVHGVDERGKTVLKKQLKRQQVLGFFSNMPRALLAWKPVAARTFGPAACRLRGTACA